MRKRTTGRKARTRIPTQREVLRDVMLTASKYGVWMTLRELSRLTGYGEASISAQLRHLRCARYGGFLVQKRVRNGEVVRGEEHFVVWEYRLSRKASQSLPRITPTGATPRRRIRRTVQ